jgi:SAM-dependent methyltransferase
MVGAKAGQQVLFLGARDARLPAEVARVTGLNGRTVVVDSDPGAERAVQSAAASAGALVEFQTDPAPAPGGAYDIVVVHQSLTTARTSPDQLIASAAQLLREGGRVVVIEGAPTAGVFARLRKPAAPAIASDQIRQLLTSAGLRAARVLAESDGVTYVEGSKPRTS